MDSFTPHTHSKSSVMNGGYSTGYFQLHRGTKQGDPLAPYLFILVIEILISMIRQNENIKGIFVNGHEFKQCVFADDTTYFLRDLESLQELKKTISNFSRFTSLCVNFEKSEIAWIGAKKGTNMPDMGIKNVNLTKQTIRILGIYNSYDKLLYKQNNFERALNNFKMTINMWKNRTLSLYGKTTILKTLAIPKLLYVSSMSQAPSDFIKEVKKAMCNFLWYGRPKIKHNVLINNHCNGGINFPDFMSLLEGQKVMWIKCLLEEEYHHWKVIPAKHLAHIGGTKTIGNNFNIKCLPKNLPPFYKLCFESWSKCFKNDPKTLKEILIQPLINNRLIPLKWSTSFVSLLLRKNIILVKDIYKKDGCVKKFSDVVFNQSKQYHQHFMTWTSMMKSIPKKWKEHIKYEKESNFTVQYDNVSHCMININGEIKTTQQLSSKLIYTSFIKNLCVNAPKCLLYQKNYGDQFNWTDVCLNIYKTSIDCFSRVFQYKIIHDILPVNYRLYKWKVKDSDRCSYCFLQKETVEHLFVECTVEITFYKNVQNWAKSINIILPELNSYNVLFGITPWNKNNALANHFLLVYKQILFYHREKGSNYSLLPHFINKLNTVVHLERIIAKSKNKLTTHDKKWKQFLS